MVAITAPADFIKHRIAVSAMFIVNGMMVGGWAPAIPAFKDKHGLVESELGLMILILGIGSLITMPITGAIIARRGSTGILQFVAATSIFTLPMLLIAPTIPLAIAALVFIGASLGSMDVAMNAHAARIEGVHERAIMSSCHGFWSLGALIGSSIGGPLLAVWGLAGQGLGLAAIMLVTAALLAPRLMEDKVERGQGIEKPKLSLPKSLGIYLIALTALAAFSAEGTVLDWAALYLRDERDVPQWMAGYAFAAFAGTMALVRFVGDPIRMKLGDLRTLQISGALAFVGFLLAGLAPMLPLTIAGFALAGLGLANIVPIGFAAADRFPGIPRGIGISIATFCGYGGLLVVPPLIGFAAEVSTFAIIFACVAVLPLYCLFVAGKIGRA